MFIVIASPPDSAAARGALMRAAERAADVVLVGPAVRLGLPGAMGGFCGSAFVLGADLADEGLSPDDLEKGVQALDYDDLLDLMIEADGLEGIF
jgi:hypothetical protein